MPDDLEIDSSNNSDDICKDRGGLRERQRQARTDAILACAFDIITENGYDALTMEDLAERVGISRQTLYQYFDSKEAIAVRAIVSLVEQGTTCIEKIDPTLPPIARLAEVIRYMLSRRFSPGNAAFVKAKLALIPLKAHPDCRAVFGRRARVIAEIVEASQSAGEVSAQFPSAVIVQMLLAAVGDANYEEVVSSGMATQGQVIECVVELFLNGLRPRNSLRSTYNQALTLTQ